MVKSVRVGAPLQAEYDGGNLAAMGPLAVLGTKICTTRDCRASGRALVSAKQGGGAGFRPKTYRLVSERGSPPSDDPTISATLAELIAGLRKKRAKLYLIYRGPGEVGEELKFTLDIESIRTRP